MVPVRRNQNWLPSIFNDFLGNDWLAERHNTTAPAVTSSRMRTNTRWKSPPRV